MKEKLNSFAEKIKGKSTVLLLIPVIIAGVLLVYFPGKDSENISDKSADIPDDSIILSDYRKELEAEFKRLVEKICGSGNAEVFLTIESTCENVYASDASYDNTENQTQKGARGENKTVLTNTKQNGEQPLLIKKMLPKVNGVAVVCEGGDKSEIKKQIISLAESVFGINTNRIYVTGGTGFEKYN